MKKEGLEMEKKKKRARLPRAGLATDLPMNPDPEAPDPRPMGEPGGPDRILRFADELARRENQAAEGEVDRGPVETWVAFSLDREQFALPVSHVREILRVSGITRVPHAPKPVRGVTNLRGRVLPVVDLRRRIGLSEGKIGEGSRILVLDVQSRVIGLLVDGVRQILRVPMRSVQPPPPDVMTDRSYYLKGVYQPEDLMIILLNVEEVLLIKESA